MILVEMDIDAEKLFQGKDQAADVMGFGQTLSTGRRLPGESLENPLLVFKKKSGIRLRLPGSFGEDRMDDFGILGIIEHRMGNYLFL